ncbi:MAG: citrate synthase, partial [Candidatus Marinamargulisbacteria bacterium]
MLKKFLSQSSELETSVFNTIFSVSPFSKADQRVYHGGARHNDNVEATHGKGLPLCLTRSTLILPKGELTIRGRSIEDLANLGRFESALAHLWSGDANNDKLLAPALLNGLGQLTGSQRFDISSGEFAPMVLLQRVTLAEKSSPDDSAFSYGIRLLSTLATTIALSIHQHKGNPRDGSRFSLGDDFATAFLSLLQDRAPKKSHVDLLNSFLILHMEHGMNLSTDAVRTISSGRPRFEAVFSAGIGALSGQRHGRANMEVCDMVDSVKEIVPRQSWGDREVVAEGLTKYYDRNQLQALPGFGHGVYRVKDPRRDLLYQLASAIALKSDDKSLSDELTLYETIETAGLDVINKKRDDLGKTAIHLPTNVDFWSGTVLKALGIPKSFFPCMFALARLGGWTFHAA